MSRGKEAFMKMYDALPEKARRKLVYDFTNHPISMNVLAIEIEHDTTLGNEILRNLGYED